MTEVVVSDVAKAFGDYAALTGVSVTIAAGELVALLGPSGSGKTTLLRVIAGIEVPDRGRILFAGVDVTERAVQDRKIGFVFQDYALFDHMSVGDNIAFGLSVRRAPRSRIDARVRELLGLVQLEGLADRRPRELSGGQRQRVALARALAPEPVLLLLDEPFGALDARVRSDLRAWIRRLHDELHVTSVFVTHDQEEALEVADRIVILNAGRIEQAGPPDEVFDHPANEFVTSFLDGVNVLAGTVADGTGKFGELVLPWPDGPDGAARAYVRRHDLVLGSEPGSGPRFPVTVSHVRRVGVTAHILVWDEHRNELVVEMPYHSLDSLGIVRGARLFAHVRALQVFSGESRP